MRDGDEFVVTGQKVWNSAAQWCDHGMLLARTDPDVPKHHGITFLLVDMASPGIEVRPLVQATGAAHFNEVFFDQVRVPVANVLGEINGGWAAARTVMANESAMIGGSGSNTFANLLLLARTFAKTDDPVVRDRLAGFYTRERALGLMADRIMTAVRRRERPPVDPSILKLFIAENRAMSGDLAVAIAGPAGLHGDNEISRWVEAEALSRYGVSIGGGTNEVQRNNLAERAARAPEGAERGPRRGVERNAPQLIWARTRDGEPDARLDLLRLHDVPRAAEAVDALTVGLLGRGVAREPVERQTARRDLVGVRGGGQRLHTLGPLDLRAGGDGERRPDPRARARARHRLAGAVGERVEGVTAGVDQHGADDGHGRGVDGHLGCRDGGASAQGREGERADRDARRELPPSKCHRVNLRTSFCGLPRGNCTDEAPEGIVARFRATGR